MLKNKIYTLNLTDYESASIFLGNSTPCNLIYSKAFTSLNTPDDLQKIKSFLASKSVRLSPVDIEDIDTDNLNILSKDSALNIFIIDGFNPKAIFLFGTLQSSKTASIAVVSSSNKDFFEKLNNLSESMSEDNIDFVKENEPFFTNLKVLSDDFLEAPLDVIEYDFSNFDNNKEEFFELVDSNIGNDNGYQKLIEDIKTQLSSDPELTEISLFLNKVESNEELSLEDYESIVQEYESLSDEMKSSIMNVNYLAISLLLQKYSDEVTVDENDLLKRFSENIVNSGIDIETSIENLKNLADACLLSDGMEEKASFFYIKALENLPGDKESATVLDIKNNLAVSLSKLGENEKAINYLQEISAFSSNKENIIKASNVYYNLGISYLNKAKESDEFDSYKKAIESFEVYKSTLEEEDFIYDGLDIESKLFYALRKAGDISKDSSVIRSSIESCKKVISMLEDNKEDKRYPEALLGLGESYLLLANHEDKIENSLKATEKFNEALEYIEETENKDLYLGIRTSMGDAYLNVSNEVEHSDKIKDAIKSYEEALRFIDPNEQPENYGVLNRNLGNSYRIDGEREREAESCHRAIDSYDQSFVFFSSERQPKEYAEIKRNIGATFEMLSQLEYESDYCTKAIDAYNEALEIFNKDEFPEKYYPAVNNLGNAYSALSEFENKEDNCNKAIECYKVASEFITFESSPIDYAMTQNNIGVAYTTLAEEIDNKSYLENAIDSYNESLRVYSFEEYPDNYAMIQNNLGDSYLDIAFFDGNPDLIKKAISAFEESKKVFEDNSNPSKYGFIMRKIARSYKELFAYESDTETLMSSIRANIESLGYFKHEVFPEEYSLIQIELGSLFSKDIKDGLNTSNIYKAIEAYKNASRYFKSDVYPIQYAKISNNLGNLHRNLSLIENKKENALEAVRYLSSAVDYIGSQSHDEDYALVLNNLGASYCVLSEVMEAESNLKKACEIFVNSLELVSEENIELMLSIKNNLANAKCSLYEINNERDLLDNVVKDYSDVITEIEKDNSSPLLPVCMNNYSNSKLLMSEKDCSHTNEDLSLILNSYESALNSILPEKHPGIYAAIKNNRACSNLFLFSHREKESYIEAAVSDIESANEALDCYGTGFMESKLNNNEAVARIYSATYSSEDDECEKAILLLKPVAEASKEIAEDISNSEKLSANINLANAYRLYHKKVGTPESCEVLINTYTESLKDFSADKNPYIYASINYFLAMLHKENLSLSDGSQQYEEYIKYLQESLNGFDADKHLYERGIVNYEIGLVYLFLFDSEKDTVHLKESIENLNTSLNIFDSEQFPSKNAHTRLNLAEAKFHLGNAENDLGLMFDSIENFESVSEYFNEKDFPNEDNKIQEKLKAAYELLLAEEKSFDDTEKGIEYYSKFLDILGSKDIEVDISTININLADLYMKLYSEQNNSESLEKAQIFYSDALKLIDKESEPEKYYNTLLSSAETDGISGNNTKEAELFNKKITKLEESLGFFTKDKDETRYININRSIADSYNELYSITEDLSQLFDSNHHYKQLLQFTEKESSEYNDIKKIYLDNKNILVDNYYESNDFQKVIDLIEKDIDFIDLETDKEYSAKAFVMLGDAYSKIAENKYEKEVLERSSDNYSKSLEYFTKDGFSEKYHSIQRNIYQNSKLLFENESDSKNLSLSINTAESLIEFAKENNLTDEIDLYSLEKAELLFSSAQNEFNAGNTKQTLLLAQQSLEHYSAENFPQKYAAIQKLMGISYFQNPGSDNLTGDLKNSIDCFNEAKNVLLNNETPSEEVGDINSYLEKAYEKILEEDGSYDSERKVDYLDSLVSIYKENEKYDSLPAAYNEIAETYFSLAASKIDIDLYRKSIKNFKNYMSYLDETSDSSEIASTHLLMGDVCSEMYGISQEKEMLSDSIEHYEKAKELSELNQEDEDVKILSGKLFDNYRQYGTIYEDKNELETALFFYDKAVDLVDKDKKDSIFYQQILKNAEIYDSLGEANNDYDLCSKAIDNFNIYISNVEDSEQKRDTHLKLGELFEKLYSINNDNSKLAKALGAYKNSLEFISGNDELESRVKQKIAGLTLEIAEKDFDESGDLSEEKYIDSLNHFTLENEPEKYAEINLKLANHSSEKFLNTKDRSDAEKAIKYYDASLRVYKKDEFPSEFNLAKQSIKSIYESFIDHEKLNLSEKEEFISKLKEIARENENNGDIAKYNLLLANNYLSEESLDEKSLIDFIPSLKESEDYADKENLDNSGEFQYSIAKLYDLLATNTDNQEYKVEASNYYQKFAQNTSVASDDSRLIEINNILNNKVLEQAESYKENGEFDLAVEKYINALQNFTSEESPEIFHDINLSLADIKYGLYQDKKDNELLSESERYYKVAESHFNENENPNESARIKERLDSIFDLKIESIHFTEDVGEKLSRVDTLIQSTDEGDFPERHFQLKKLKAFSLVDLYDSTNNPDDIGRAENALNEVLHSVEQLGSEEDAAEINLNYAFINQRLYAINEEREKLDYALALYKSSVEFYEKEDNEEKIAKIKPAILEVEEILATFDTVETVDEQVEEIQAKDAEAPEEKEIQPEEEPIAADEVEQTEDVLELSEEMIEDDTSLELVDDESAADYEESTLLSDQPDEESEGVETVDEPVEEIQAKDAEAPEEKEIQPEEELVEDKPTAPSMTEEYIARLEVINEKDSPKEFAELSAMLAKSFAEDAANGVNLLGYSEAIKNYKKALDAIDENNFADLYAKIVCDLVSTYPENVIEIDLREYKYMLGVAEKALEHFNEKDFPMDYGSINKNIGIVNTSLAEREGQLKYYKDSIPFYDKALKSITKDSSLLDFAIINMNLGIAYGVISEIEFDSKAFMKSINSYEKSLESFDENESPDEYALVNKYLGIAYGTYGERNNDSDYLEKSVVCYENALKYFSIDDPSNDYGLINRNLGNNYLKLIETNNDPEFCKRGIESYERALKFYLVEKTPFVYASIYNNIGSIYSALSDIENKVENCKLAIDSYERVLKVYNINDNPMEFAAANNNLGIAHRNLAEVVDKVENSTKAIEFYEKALKAYTLKEFPIQYSNTQNNLGTAFRTLAEEDNKIDNCKKAISSYKEALKVRTMENMPIQFAATQNNLGVAYRTLSEVESKSKNCKNAISAYEAALIVYSFDKFPIQYATTRNNLAGAYSTLAESEDKKLNYTNSIKSYREAQKVFSQNQFPDIYNMIEENIIFLENNVD